MELQDLQNNWNSQFDTKGNKANLVLQLFKESRQNKVKSKLIRLVIYSSLFIIYNVWVIIKAWVFIADNFPNTGVLITGAALLTLSFIALYMNVFQLNDMANIKFSLPVIELQKTIEKLKIRRIRFMRYIFIFSNLYFWLMVCLVFKWNLIDLIATVWQNAAFVVVFHVAGSVLWFPFAFWLLRKYDIPEGKSKFWNKMSKESYLTDHSVNSSLNRSLSFLQEIEVFEKS